MPPRSPSPPTNRRRSRSPPPPASRRRDDYDYDDRDRRGGERRHGGGGAGRDERDRDRDRRGGYGARGGGGGGRDRSRSPPRRGGGGEGGGDGGWGRRGGAGGDRSPGRPSKALADQKDLVPGGGGGGGGDMAYGKRRAEGEGEGDKGAPVKSVEPDFKPSGALAAETNTLNGVVLKYAEPPEARKPVRNWRLYVFKGKEQVELFHVHRQSAYLVGRDRIVADIPVDHPSTSKQHAVLQFRQVMERSEFGDTKSLTKPFIIDLDSANGTLVNDAQIPASRYYELRSGDVLKFAFSTREYVLLVES
ncbi:hypothetical protein JCM11251_006872 [Rhodosporidiobolus azoricus]